MVYFACSNRLVKKQSKSEETQIKRAFINGSHISLSHLKTTSFEFLIIKNQRILRRIYIYITDRGMIVLQLQHVLEYRPYQYSPCVAHISEAALTGRVGYLLYVKFIL
jgi:hypothetical protein